MTTRNHTNSLVVAGDFNHSFQNGVGLQAAVFMTSNNDVISPYILPSFSFDEKDAISATKIVRGISNSGRIDESVSLSDHAIMATRIPVYPATGDKPTRALNTIVWNVNSKTHNSPDLSPRMATELRKRKLHTIASFLNEPRTSIVILTEWGNVKFERKRGESKKDYDTRVPQEFATKYGHLALQQIGVSVATIRQFVGKAKMDRGSADPTKAEWVMYVGEAGKVVFVRTSIVMKRTNGIPALGLPIKMNDPVVKSMGDGLKTFNRYGERTNITTGMIELKINKTNSVYLMAVHDTALGAYKGNKYDRDRWSGRIDMIYEWFSKHF